MTIDATDVTATTVTFDQLSWFPLDPGNPDGVRMAALWGDPMTGPFGGLLHVPAGFESPLHRHSNTERVVILRGTSVHWTEGESREDAIPVTTGDFVVMPAGVNHVSATTGNEDCLEFITMDGKFDFEPA